MADYAQDGAGWVSDGLLDLAVPTMYMRESVTEHAQWYRQWLVFGAELDERPAGAAVAVGIGGWMNTVAGGLAQAREALHRTAGVAVFSYQQDSRDGAWGLSSASSASPDLLRPARWNSDCSVADVGGSLLEVAALVDQGVRLDREAAGPRLWQGGA